MDTEPWTVVTSLERFAERTDPRENWLTKLEGAVRATPRSMLQWLQGGLYRSKLAKINRLESELRLLDDEELQTKCHELRASMGREGLKGHLVTRCFALVREASRRVIGLRHYDVQIIAGLTMLDGAVAEMDTGEGKTITAALTATAAAYGGLSVHVITVNEYLAVRDSETLAPIYRFMGLDVAVVTNGLSPQERSRIYGANIVYTSNNEITFDYLRDRIVLGRQPNILRMKLSHLLGDVDVQNRLVMRGLHFAIVDEADSVLIDEARTPLIISQETDGEDERQWAEQAFQIVEDFVDGQHYRIKLDERRIELLDAGLQEMTLRSEIMGGIWLNRIRREEAGRQTLAAKFLFKNGEHYLINDGKVEIVDEYTGRLMPDRSWSDGLHQLIELKEACEVTSRKNPIARMTYQRFFRRYMRLAGMTGTASEVRGELWSVYRLAVRRIPPNRTSRRKKLKTIICPTEDEKWRRIVERTASWHAMGRPVLIATRSVIASQTIAEWLQDAGLSHVVLNAERSAEEAEIIAQAGCPGQITVATNMAGRGVDIAIDAQVIEQGGLHIILSERHDAGRIDRQMEGRTARRGEPGTCVAILSMDDPLLDVLPSNILRTIGRQGGFPGRLCGLLSMARAQWRAERSHAKERKILLRQDRRLGVLFAFSGGAE